MSRAHLAHHPCVQRVVGFQRLVGRLDALVDDVLPGLVLAELRADANGFAYALSVELLLEVVVVEYRLHSRIAGLQFQFARAYGKIESDNRANTDGSHAISATVYATGGEDVHIDNHVVFEVRVACGVAQTELYARPECLKLVLRLRRPSNIDERMVAQVLSHAGRILEHQNAHLVEMVGRPNARQHKNLRRANRARAQDNLAAFDDEALASALHIHAGRPVVLEDDAMDRAVGANGQVEPMPRQTQIAKVRAPAYALRVVQRQRPHAGRVRRIMVWAVGEAVVEAGLVERLGRAAPLLFREAMADDGPVRAVVVVAVSGVRLQLAEVRQRVLECPLIVAPRRPAVVVVWHAAQENLPIDGAGSARYLAARHQHRLCLLGGARRELPVVVARHDVGRGRVAVLDLFGQVVQFGVVRPSLQQQH